MEAAESRASGKDKGCGETKAAVMQTDRSEEDAEAEVRLAAQTEQEAHEKLETKRKLRESNLNFGKYPEAGFFKTLDSSLKRNTAFVRKLKLISEDQRASIVKEAAELNLTRYLEEVAQSIAEARIKTSDFGLAVDVCSQLHQRYSEFLPLLVSAVDKSLVNVKQIVKDAGKDESALSKLVVKYRTALRLTAELLIYGLIKDASLFLNPTRDLIGADREHHQFFNVVATLCRHCNEDLIGTVPRKQRLLLDKYAIPVRSLPVLSLEQQKQLVSYYNAYYVSLADRLQKVHRQLFDLDERNYHIMQTKGDLHEKRQQEFQDKQAEYERVLSYTNTLADLLDKDMPQLPVWETRRERDMAISLGNVREGDGDFAADSLWDDEDTQSFYESLVDLRAFVPAVLLGEKPRMPSDSLWAHRSFFLSPVGDPVGEEKGEQTVSDESTADTEMTEAGVEPAENSDPLNDDDEDIETCNELFNAEEAAPNAALSALDVILARLPNTMNRDEIDNLAAEFCYVNNKGSRKRLVRTVYNVPNSRLELIPYYCRLIATLDKCLPDVKELLDEAVQRDFRIQVRRKDQLNLESKMRIMRFVAEMTKFGICNKHTALNNLQALVNDFHGHSILMACALLENAGRFLYRSPESHVRTKAILDIMMRKKQALHLDSRMTNAIDNAFYYCNPPERVVKPPKQRPPVHAYIRRLLYKDLSRATADRVLKQMRKISWDNAADRDYALKCLSKPWKVKYNHIHCLASLVAGLNHYHNFIGVYVADAVLEDVRLGLESERIDWNARRISVIKYLGELYNYRIIESSLVFEVFYSLITFGHVFPVEGPSFSKIDPPEDFFRIRLVCTLLDSCGQYFDRGSTKKKLDYFLVFFQRYFLSKSLPLPMEIEFLIADTIETLRPKLSLAKTYAEAEAAVVVVQEEMRAKMLDRQAQVGDSIRDGSSSSSDDGDEDREAGSGDEGEARGGGARHSDDELEAEHNGSSSSDDDRDEDEGNGDEFDQVQLREKPQHIITHEDEAFLEEMNKFMLDQVTQRRTEAPVAMALDIAIPMKLRQREEFVEPESAEEVGPRQMKFTLMTRKGNKPQLKEIAVPVNSALVQSVQKHKATELAEQAERKRFVLGYEERAEQADNDEGVYDSLDLSSRASAPEHVANRGRGQPFRRGNQRERREV